jgi:tRNA_anti-like
MKSPQIALLFGLSLAAPLAAQNSYAPTKIARMDAASYLQPLPKDGVVSLKTLAGDFASNETAATGKYADRRITVIGRVSSLSNGNSENKVLAVTLQDASANLPAVKCNFLFGSIPQNSSIEVSSDGSQAFLIRRDRSGNILGREPYLSVDQKVAIKGDFKELKVGDIVLTACKLLSSEKRRMLESGR